LFFSIIYLSFFVDGYNDVTFVIPVEDKNDTFVVGLCASIGVVEWDGISDRTGRPEYVKLLDETSGNRLNDGKADATGRIWAGKLRKMLSGSMEVMQF
jgi:sugar lactone lactonase YvrE